MKTIQRLFRKKIFSDYFQVFYQDSNKSVFSEYHQ